MVIKTLVMLSIYILPLVLLATGSFSNVWAIIGLYILSGLGMAGIGMGIMHDANHGAYSKNFRLNTIFSSTLDFLGCSSAMWKLQHNVLHHTYTNIHGHDEDINTPVSLLKFSPHKQSNGLHQYQHWYVWGFYSILTLYWITAKDFVKALNYYDKGLIRTKKELRMAMFKIALLKLFYFSYALVLPIIYTDVAAYWIILGFVIKHIVAGTLLSVVFQLAHVMPEMDFPQPENETEIQNNWHIHQLMTTSNFSPKNPIQFWLFGGLTHQIEHHLFPNICHVHYKNLSRLVKQTALEYNIPYYENKTLLVALKGHIATLKKFGIHEDHAH